MIWDTVSSRSCFYWLYKLLHLWCKERNQSDFGIDHLIWWCPYVETSLELLEKGVCYDQHVLLTKPLAFHWFISFSKAKLVCYSGYLLTSCFCIPIPCDEKDIFFLVLVLEGLVGLHRTSQLQFPRYHRLGLLLCWTVCLWKQTEIILSFLRLHPKTSFWTLVLTMRATPFLLRDSCPQ